MSPTTARKRIKSAASPLPTNTAAVIVLKWSGAYVSDVIPLDWFQDDLPLKGVKHPMSEGRGKLSGEEAQCDVSKEGLVATLDYLPYKKPNDRHEVLPRRRAPDLH
ncbi:MAG: hypothetical protein H2172_17950 [Opitutus sp.]|nr:hypothetical protein [Opitutus sp.]MCS6246373.1 hypothetical protein [Opitutus sp.]MCS6275310.1 hypothetical protein [Opitutus sp.]MCS6278297.1 hypothetical protein [Opitutus sp.]MCS6299407.1 hypothetical protein [Opitutus sp.]